MKKQLPKIYKCKKHKMSGTDVCWKCRYEKQKDIPRSGLAQEPNNCPHLSCQCIMCGEIIGTFSNGSSG